MIISQFAISTEIGSALISGGARLLGGLLGNKSTSDTNKTNLQIAREQNQYNYEQWLRERDFTIDMWNRQNAYNDPAAQKSRMLNAGINPYLADIDVGNAGSATTPAGSPAAGATMQPKNFDYIGDSVATGVGQYVSLKMADAQIEQMKEQNDLLRTQVQSNNIQNFYMADKLQGEIDANAAAVSFNRWSAERNRQDVLFKNSLFPQEYAQAVATTKEKEMGITALGFQIGLQSVQLEMARMQLAWLPKEKEQEYKNLISQGAMYNAAAYASHAAGAASYSQVRLNAGLLVESAARQAGIKLDNKLKEESMPYAIKALQIANRTAWYQSEMARKDNASYNTDKWINRISGAIGTAAGAALGFGAVKGSLNIGKGVQSVRKSFSGTNQYGAPYVHDYYNY